MSLPSMRVAQMEVTRSLRDKDACMATRAASSHRTSGATAATFRYGVMLAARQYAANRSVCRRFAFTGMPFAPAVEPASEPSKWGLAPCLACNGNETCRYSDGCRQGG